MPHVQTSRDVNGAPIRCIGVTAGSLHKASCTVQDDHLPATVVYDLDTQQDIEQIVMLSDWWSKRPDGGSVEVCFEYEYVPGVGCSAHADPLDQCLAETGKGIYADPLSVGDQTRLAPPAALLTMITRRPTPPPLRPPSRPALTGAIRRTSRTPAMERVAVTSRPLMIPRVTCCTCALHAPSRAGRRAALTRATARLVATSPTVSCHAELPGDGCRSWLNVANFQFSNNQNTVCEVDGCGHCCWSGGDNCEAPEVNAMIMMDLY